MTIHDVNTYAELGALAPEPDPDTDVDLDGNCTRCGDYYCGPDCRPLPRIDPRDEPDGVQGRERFLDLEERGL